MDRTKHTVANQMMLKQYLRWLPAQLGLFNKAAFLLQIDSILSDDIFVASYPKSGNTWLRFVLANMKGKGEAITFQNIDTYIPDVYTSKEIINSQKSHRIIKTHQTLFDYYSKTIYIYRDYRDVLVSFYYYEKALNHFSGTLEQFISSQNVVEPFGSWKKHVKLALEFKQKHPEKMLLLSYESLLENPIANIESIAKFCEIKPTLSYKEINERCTFSKLKEDETKHSSDFKNESNEHFFREGKKGKWAEHFTDSMIKKLQSDKELNLIMEKLEYTY
ncbi:sulfotransferase domain-containing protein [soil metagenome]